MKYSLHDHYSSGIIVSLASLKSANGVGIGEYPDLVALGALCRSLGMDLIQLLPVNDSGRESSPYSAQSAFALHPIYARLSDFPESRGFEIKIHELRDSFDADLRFRYKAMLDAKHGLLHAMYAKNRDSIAANPDMQAWVGKNPWIKPYAVYCALKEREAYRAWYEWAGNRDPTPDDIARFCADPSLADEIMLHVWIQYRCEQQFLHASRELAAMGVFLKGDLPILMNQDSADVWVNRAYFNLELRAGAPPDMFSHLGQNWSFPLYNWDVLESDNYRFWIERLNQADKFYSAFRIDHVLGFFRIWAMGVREESGYLGRFVPGCSIEKQALFDLGMDNARIRWLSEPHISKSDMAGAFGAMQNARRETDMVIMTALDRIGEEDLYLFKRSILGERDIMGLPLGQEAKDFLLAQWRERLMLETESGRYVPTWRYYETNCWSTLPVTERSALENLFAGKMARDEKIWEAHGEKLLTILKGATRMLPCAEDLGAVPDCVPVVLERLGILGLRIPRWTRSWNKPGQPFVPLDEYPRLSVCAPSVHDTSTLRDEWEHEAGKYELWNFLRGKESCSDTAGSSGAAECPEAWSPGLAKTILHKLSGCSSQLFVLQLQDILALSPEYIPVDSRQERINAPGTINEFNWTWRMPVLIETLSRDEEWKANVTDVLSSRPGAKEAIQ